MRWRLAWRRGRKKNEVNAKKASASKSFGLKGASSVNIYENGDEMVPLSPGRGEGSAKLISSSFQIKQTFPTVNAVSVFAQQLRHVDVSRLVELDLSYSGLTGVEYDYKGVPTGVADNSGLGALVDALLSLADRNHPNADGAVGLRILSLRGNHINDAGAAIAARLLHDFDMNQSPKPETDDADVLAHPRLLLSSLNLSNNEIWEDGAAHLSRALGRNNYIESLNLASNAIRNGGAIAIADALRRNSALAILDLSNNFIFDNGGVALASSLAVNDSLSTLNLIGNQMGLRTQQAFAKSLVRNKTLDSLLLNASDGGQTVHDGSGDNPVSMTLEEAIMTATGMNAILSKEQKRLAAARLSEANLNGQASAAAASASNVEETRAAIAQDVQRLIDHVKSLEPTIVQLEKEVDEAERRQSEASAASTTASSKLQKLSLELRSATEQRRELENKCGELEYKKELLTTRRDSALSAAQESIQGKQDMREALARMEARVEEARASTKSYRTKCAKLTAQIETARRSATNASRKCEAAEADLGAFEERIAELEENLAAESARGSGAHEDLLELTGDLERAVAERDAADKKKSGVLRDVKEKRSKAAAIEEKLLGIRAKHGTDLLHQRCEELEAQNSRLQVTNEELLQRLALTEGLQEREQNLQEEVEMLRKQIKEKNDICAELEEGAGKMRREISTLKSKIAAAPKKTMVSSRPINVFANKSDPSAEISSQSRPEPEYEREPEPELEPEREPKREPERKRKPVAEAEPEVASEPDLDIDNTLDAGDIISIDEPTKVRSSPVSDKEDVDTNGNDSERRDESNADSGEGSKASEDIAQDKMTPGNGADKATAARYKRLLKAGEVFEQKKMGKEKRWKGSRFIWVSEKLDYILWSKSRFTTKDNKRVAVKDIIDVEYNPSAPSLGAGSKSRGGIGRRLSFRKKVIIFA